MSEQEVWGETGEFRLGWAMLWMQRMGYSGVSSHLFYRMPVFMRSVFRVFASIGRRLTR